VTASSGNGEGVLTDDVVHVWWIALDETPLAAATLETVLDEREREHHLRLPDSAQRRRYRIAHGAARLILGDYLHTPAHELVWRTGRWGKPRLAAVHDRIRFNLSHCADIAVLAVTGRRDVGVDVECPRPHLAVERFATRYFPARESQLVRSADPADRQTVFLRLWTRKEACVKAAGGRLGQGLALPVADGRTATVVADPSANLPGPWRVANLTATHRLAAAVALRGADTYRVVQRRWPAHHAGALTEHPPIPVH
jgi:4'-phosphopantetheinyl transferase